MIDGSRIALSLVSHTNVGKTTLARTLLGRDIGEVRDEAHVTLEAERHTMIESPVGDRLELWDTPGFGDSVRLAKRLAQAGNPIGWFMGEVWDRFKDRAFWSSQRALRNVLDEADLVLYLVNASESPDDAGYVNPELQVLALIGKPVIALLNQLGPPQAPDRERAEIARWQQRLAALGVRDVLALDAFARCWVQEGRLLDAVAAALPLPKRPAFIRLRAAWAAQQHAIWQGAMRVLAERLARAALDRAEVDEAGWTGRLREIGAAVGLRREGQSTPREDAMRTLALRLDTDIRESTGALIRLHRLAGDATAVVLTRLAEHYAVREPVHEGKAAVLGGVVSGALMGLKADIASGGMTLGGGLLAGGVLGALGAAGLARGYNLVRGVKRPTLAWTDAVLDELARSALLGYLAVVHYGRGRGDWADAEHPVFWIDAVDAAVKDREASLQAIWARRASALSDSASGTTKSGSLIDDLQIWLDAASQTLLVRLYPNAAALDAFAPSAASAPALAASVPSSLRS